MYTDLLLLILIGVFAILGFVRGFVHQVISLAVYLCIVLFSVPLAHDLKWSSAVDIFRHSPLFILWVGVSLSLIFMGFLIRFIIESALKRKILRPIDRWLGFFLGAVKGVFVACVISVCIQILPENIKDRFRDFNSDVQQSKAVEASSNLLDWKFISSIKILDQIRTKLHQDATHLEKGTPWNDDFGVDSH